MDIQLLHIGAQAKPAHVLLLLKAEEEEADKASFALHFPLETSSQRGRSPHILRWQRGCQPPPTSSPTHHPWLKECSGKRGTRDRRSEALIRTTLCVVLLFPISCVLRIRSETAFDEYLQRDLRLIKSGNLARYVILSLVIWEVNSLIGRARGACGVYQADEHQVCTLKRRVSWLSNP